MNKKVLLFFALFGILIIVGAAYLYSNRAYLSADYNENKFSIKVEAPLQKDKLKIYQGFYTINRESDFEILDNKSVDGKLIFDKELLSQIENDYGENDFLFIYDDMYYYQFRHLKSWNRQVDNYQFSLQLKNDTIYLSADIEGTDPLKLTDKPFQLIKNADSLEFNTKIIDKK